MKIEKKISPITKELIFSKIDSYDIYRYEIANLQIGRSISNPLRRDQHPSLSIFMGDDGQLRHIDYADESYKGDCIALVQQKYGLSYTQALQKIALTFQITDGNPEGYKQIVSQYTKPDIQPKKHALIQCTAMKWQPSYLRYWNNYLIDENELKMNEIYCLNEVYLNRKKIPIKPGELVYGYYYEEGWKIMFPERKKEEKWLSNIPLVQSEKLCNLNKDYNTIVIPAKKCRIVAAKIYPYVCNIQNESVGAISDEVAKYITENSKEVWYWGNSDKPGKEASYKITKKYGWHHINNPDPMLPKTKDISDWSRDDQDIKKIEQHMKIKGII